MATVPHGRATAIGQLPEYKSIGIGVVFLHAFPAACRHAGGICADFEALIPVEFSLPLLMGRFDSLPTILIIRSTARFQREKKATPLASTDAIVRGGMCHMASRSNPDFRIGGSSGALSVLGAVLTCIALIGQLAGCNRSSQESQVSGVVTLDGKAVGPGSVAFAPVDKEKPATGPIDASGNYSMTTGHEVGLSAGKYKVALSI